MNDVTDRWLQTLVLMGGEGCSLPPLTDNSDKCAWGLRAAIVPDTAGSPALAPAACTTCTVRDVVRGRLSAEVKARRHSLGARATDHPQRTDSRTFTQSALCWLSK
ncbi:hypothetical protein J6590_034549 [Homalodisca vitripennis]|nr:hypothetical protein J6590_034549 [Homalodisca vitripennis]